MFFISPENEWPRYIGDIQLEHPDFTEGADLPDGWIAVEETEPPTVSEGQIFEQAQPTEVDGVMTQQWLVRDLTPEEIARRNAPETARAKLIELGLTEYEIQALSNGLIS